MRSAMLMILLTAATASLAEGPHPPPHVDACMSCHNAADKARLDPRVTRPCAQMCLSCHQKLEGHHPVGVKIDKVVPAPLLLTADGRNTCSTCHDLSAPATADTPWRSQSFIQWIANRPKVNRTYHLVMRNDRGQLCRNCH